MPAPNLPDLFDPYRHSHGWLAILAILQRKFEFLCNGTQVVSRGFVSNLFKSFEIPKQKLEIPSFWEAGQAQVKVNWRNRWRVLKGSRNKSTGYYY